jgi:hypothetical protein
MKPCKIILDTSKEGGYPARGSVVQVPLVVSVGKDRRSRRRSRGFSVFGHQTPQCGVT